MWCVSRWPSLGRVPVWLFAAEKGAEEDYPCHSGPRQQPLVEALLAFPALGGSIVPVEIHKPLLKAEGEHRVRCCEWQEAEYSTDVARSGWNAHELCLAVVG